MSQPKSYPLRMPDAIREHFEILAKENSRSLNAEILIHLEAVMNLDELKQDIESSLEINKRLSDLEARINSVDLEAKMKELEILEQKINQLSLKKNSNYNLNRT